MLITKKSTRKKRSYFDIFSKFYSYLSLILLACILLLLFSTGYLNKYKEAFLYRFYKSSVNYYIDIFPIGFNALKGAFYTFPELNINISFNNVIKLFILLHYFIIIFIFYVYVLIVSSDLILSYQKFIFII